MGMDMACGDCCIKVGSYSRINRIHCHLLVALKEYLEMYTLDSANNNDDRIGFLCELIGNDTIHKRKYKLHKSYCFMKEKLEGFFPFIFHLEDYQGTMTSDEADCFIVTFEKVYALIKPNLNRHLENDKNLLETLTQVKDELLPIFKESRESGKDITFF